MINTITYILSRIVSKLSHTIFWNCGRKTVTLRSLSHSLARELRNNVMLFILGSLKTKGDVFNSFGAVPIQLLLTPSTQWWLLTLCALPTLALLLLCLSERVLSQNQSEAMRTPPSSNNLTQVNTHVWYIPWQERRSYCQPPSTGSVAVRADSSVPRRPSRRNVSWDQETRAADRVRGDELLGYCRTC